MAIQECVHQSLRVQGFEFAESGQPDKEGDRLLWLQGDKLYERASFRFEPTAEFVIDYGDVRAGISEALPRILTIPSKNRQARR